MAYEKKDMEGTLFINDRKEKDTDSDRSGWIKINGQEYWLNGWNKDDGRISLRLKIKK